MVNNIKTLFNTRENVLKLYDDYAELMIETKSYFLQGKGIKISTPKQILQRLPVALARKLLK